MYQIFYDGALVFDPRGANCAEPGDKTYALTEGHLTLAVGTAGQLTMTLDAGHPMISRMAARLGVVKVVELIGGTAATIFLGRIIRDTLHFDNSHTYECEGRLACLNDTVMTPYYFPTSYESDPDYQTALANNTVPAYWLGKLLSIHNDMAWDANNQIQPGTVTVTGGAFERSSDTWENLWRILSGDLPESELGGYLVMRYSGDAAYLDYLASFPDTNGQAVTFGANLLDITRNNSAEDYFNAVVPLGKDGLTCLAAANGYYGTDDRYYKSGTYIVTPAERDAGYGNVVRVVSWDDVDSASDLVTKAVSYLDTAAFVDEVEISAADLSVIDGSTPAFRIGRLLTIDNPPQNMRTAYAVMGLGIDVLGDAETQITLGARGVSLTSRLA